MKKILAIVDSYNWALFNRANNLKKNLDADFDIKYFKDLDDISFDNYDVVYSLNWPIHGYIHSKIAKNRKYRLVTSISSHCGRKDAESIRDILKNYDAISTSSKLLFNEFSKKYKNVHQTSFGVDTNLFQMLTKPGDNNKVFGWVGNKNRKIKNFERIEKVFRELGDEYTLKIASMETNYNQKQMANFYNTIGTLICFSQSEGTPNPILEAASCGRAIISTKVGNVLEINDNEKIIEIVKNDKELKNAIIKFSKNKDLINKNGTSLRKKMKSEWDWSIRAKKFEKFLGLK